MEQPSQDSQDSIEDSIEEQRKRSHARPVWITLGFLSLTLALTVLYFREIETPSFFPGNLLVLTLLELNLILLVLLGLLLSRNLIKHYFERRRKMLGAGFRGKLIAAFVGFASIPTILLLIVASGLLTSSIENWFSIQVERPLDNALQTAQLYYQQQEETARYTSRILRRQIEEGSLLSDEKRPELLERLKTKRSEYRVQGIEFYPVRQNVKPLRFLDPAAPERAFLPVSPDALTKAFGGQEVMEKPTTDLGSLIRAVVPVRAASDDLEPNGVVGALAVDILIQGGLSSKMDEITKSFEDYKQLKAFKNPIKESYILSFVVIAFVILFSATWFGFYLAKSITVPLQKLAEGTEAIAHGNLDFKIHVRARDELGVVVHSFNKMTEDLRISKTQIEEANRSLRRSNIEMDRRRAYIETVLENIATGVISLDRQGRITTINHSAEKIFRTDGREIAGKLARDAFQALSLTPLLHLLDEMETRPLDGLERELHLTVSGKPLTLGVSFARMKDDQDLNVGLVIVVEDLTELIQAQKAAAWQEVAQRIAHEIKNPLTPIQLSAQRLRKKYFEQAPDFQNIVDESTATIINEVAGLKRLVDEFSNFARLPAPMPSPNDLHAILQEVILLYRSAHRDLEFITAYDSGLPRLNLDREQLKRVFVNLFENAVEAMSGRGRFWITTRFDGSRRKAVVTIEDEGIGIPAEDMDKLFLPHFSRKKTGSGLGLAIVHRIIKDHNGQIQVASREPKGTAVTIELPAGEPAAGPAAKPDEIKHHV
ncbi:MAG: HAMP domain-containing protein [Nitrospirae bacterium]|nr:HAMP domain-containing protein [Nitrospirota bacterium]